MASAVSESNRKFCDSRLKNTYQTSATPPTRNVATSGVWKRGWMRPKLAGIAFWRAIDSSVRDAGRIVVCAEAMPEVMIAMITMKSEAAQRALGDRAQDRRRRPRTR